MKLSLSSKDLIQEFSSEAFRQNTLAQIIKDFGVVGHDIETSLNDQSFDIEDLIELVMDSLNQVMKDGEVITMRLLYQIDIPQKDFLSLIEDDLFLSKMSQMIVRREAYKVYLRTKF